MSWPGIIIDRVALAKQGDNALGSIRLSIQENCVCVCNQGAYGDNLTGAVD